MLVLCLSWSSVQTMERQMVHCLAMLVLLYCLDRLMVLMVLLRLMVLLLMAYFLASNLA